VKIFIPGEPVAQPRHNFRVIKSGGRFICKPYIKSDHPIHAFKEAVQLAFKQAGGKMHEGPVGLTIMCIFPRPKSHSKKRSSKMEWKPSKPDSDNLGKSILDALNKIAYADDSQVVCLTVKKMFAFDGMNPGVSVAITKEIIV